MEHWVHLDYCELFIIPEQQSWDQRYLDYSGRNSKIKMHTFKFKHLFFDIWHMFYVKETNDRHIERAKRLCDKYMQYIHI